MKLEKIEYTKVLINDKYECIVKLTTWQGQSGEPKWQISMYEFMKSDEKYNDYSFKKCEVSDRIIHKGKVYGRLNTVSDVSHAHSAKEEKDECSDEYSATINRKWAALGELLVNCYLSGEYY